MTKLVRLHAPWNGKRQSWVVPYKEGATDALGTEGWGTRVEATPRASILDTPGGLRWAPFLPFLAATRVWRRCASADPDQPRKVGPWLSALRFGSTKCFRVRARLGP